MIESSSNAQIKKIQKLKKTAKYRREEGLFVVEGWKMTEEALNRQLVKNLYVAAEAEEKFKERLKSVPYEVLSDKLFRELSDTVTPQGILAVVQMPYYDKEILMFSEEAALLCLEDIQDPGNLGTMVRTAEGAGMAGIVLSKGCVDLFNPKVVRSTMGALFRVPFYICDDFAEELEQMKKNGFTLYAAHLKGTCDYTEVDYKGRTAILIGNEANGLTEETSELAQKLVKIPMEGQLESLNAAVSAALLMYEVHRNRE